MIVLCLLYSTQPMILVMNKIDSAPPDCCDKKIKKEEIFHKSVFTSALTGQGIEELEEAILEILGLDRVPTGGHQWTVNQVCLNSTCNSISDYKLLNVAFIPLFMCVYIRDNASS